MYELALFAGAGGGLLAGRLLGWRTVCAVELDDYARSVLLRRQNDGELEAFPIWDDIRTFDGRPWCGRVDVVSGGFPCQDISAAGKGKGIGGERSGLWSEMFRIVREVRPRYVFVENSPLITSRGLGRVLGDLASAGFDAEWGVLSAADVGAPHLRKRFWCVATDRDRAELRHAQQRPQAGWIDVQARGLAVPRHDGEAQPMADSDRSREPQSEGAEPEERRRSFNGGQSLADSNMRRREQRDASERELSEPREGGVRGQWWAAEPDVGRVAHGVAARVDRLRVLGNGQVPLVAASAWLQLRERLDDNG